MVKHPLVKAQHREDAIDGSERFDDMWQQLLLLDWELSSLGRRCKDLVSAYLQCHEELLLCCRIVCHADSVERGGFKRMNWSLAISADYWPEQGDFS